MSKPRSLPQHNRFFALMQAAHNHWPEAHPFQPDSVEHLRAWLLVRAKHCVINSFHMGEDAGEAAKLLPIITATMMRKHCWAKAKGSELQVCVPISIDFKTVPQSEFARICGDVEEIIEAETGLQIADIMRQAA